MGDVVWDEPSGQNLPIGRFINKPSSHRNFLEGNDADAKSLRAGCHPRALRQGRASAGEKLAEWEIKAPQERGLSTENKGYQRDELRRSERRI